MVTKHWKKQFVMLLLILGGCAPTPSNVTQTPEVAPTVMQFPTATQTIPAIPTGTPSLVPVEEPAFTTEYVRDYWLAEFEDNGGCELPCVLGITPGQSNFEEMEQSLLQMQEVHGEKLRVTVTTPGDVDDSKQLTVVFQEDESEVLVNVYYGRYGTFVSSVYLTLASQLLEGGEAFDNPVFMDTFASYSLPQILATYGTPDGVYLYVEPDAPQVDSDIRLDMVYLSLGVEIQYRVKKISGLDSQSQYTGCPLGAAFIEVFTWNPRAGEPGEFPRDAINWRPLDYYKSIEAATSMSVGDFYATFLHADSATCFQTPVELWPEY